MTFNWVDFLNANNIPYVTSGPNTKRGEISIACPMCGDDPSQHLGINLRTGAWGCWRNRFEHKGRRPYKLIVHLLGCSYAHARMIVDQYSLTDTKSFDSLTLDFDEKEDPDFSSDLRFPNEFRQIKSEGTTLRFWKYLRRRGFGNVNKLTRKYNLKCCNTGPWKDRIIIPVYENNELVSWTGRAIAPTEKAPRYKTLSTEEPGYHQALIKVTDTLFLYDQLTGGDMLFVNEGPIDALKIDFYGNEYGAHATCLFTSSISTNQIYLISQVAKRYKDTWLLLDPEATQQQFEIYEILKRYGIKIAELKEGIEDPGAMTRKQVIELINSLS